MTDSPAPIPIPFFTPVPLARSRHDGWTPARQRIFIAALAASGIVSKAAKAAGMGMTSAYALRRRKGAEGFAAAWDMVLDGAREHALAHVIEHVMNGATTPRFYGGRFIGTIHRVDHKMAMAALRALDAVPPRRQAK